MADRSDMPPDHTVVQSGGGNTGLAFVVGILVVVVAVIAWFVFAGDPSGAGDQVNVTIEGAGDNGAIEGAENRIGSATSDFGESAEPAAE